MQKPLRELTKKKAVWSWGKEHDKAFQALKDSLCDSQILAFYDLRRATKVLVDGSPTGVAAILTQQQDDQTYIVAYASRALTS